MSAWHLHLILPGPVDQRTGGYLYDARMSEQLRAGGWTVEIHPLEGRFPEPDATAVASLGRTLRSIPSGHRTLIDGLALAALPLVPGNPQARLRLLGLVHHPLGDETGLEPGLRERLLELEREALASCRGVVVTSPFTAGRVARLEVPSERIRVALPGTRPAGLVRGPRPGEDAHLICVASVIPRKGQDVLLDALERIRDLPWRCTCAGSLDRDPAFASSVRGRAEAAGLGGRVHFIGECTDRILDELYASASLLVLPSHYEGYGMVLSEALARGLPVVSTTGGAIPSTVPEDAGILVPPGDAEELARALRRLLGSRDGAGVPQSATADPPDEGPATELERLADGALRHRSSLPDWVVAGAHFARCLLELTPGEAG